MAISSSEKRTLTIGGVAVAAILVWMVATRDSGAGSEGTADSLGGALARIEEHKRLSLGISNTRDELGIVIPWQSISEQELIMRDDLFGKLETHSLNWSNLTNDKPDRNGRGLDPIEFRIDGVEGPIDAVLRFITDLEDDPIPYVLTDLKLTADNSAGRGGSSQRNTRNTRGGNTGGRGGRGGSSGRGSLNASGRVKATIRLNVYMFPENALADPPPEDIAEDGSFEEEAEPARERRRPERREPEPVEEAPAEEPPAESPPESVMMFEAGVGEFDPQSFDPEAMEAMMEGAMEQFRDQMTDPDSPMRPMMEQMTRQMMDPDFQMQMIEMMPESMLELSRANMEPEVLDVLDRGDYTREELRSAIEQANSRYMDADGNIDLDRVMDRGLNSMRDLDFSKIDMDEFMEFQRNIAPLMMNQMGQSMGGTPPPPRS